MKIVKSAKEMGVHGIGTPKINCNECGIILQKCYVGNPDCKVKRHHLCGECNDNVGLGIPDPCNRLTINYNAEYAIGHPPSPDKPLEIRKQMYINELAQKHWEWVESVGWHDDKRILEYLALIASEIGECVNECRGKKPTEFLGEELADIVLRVFDTALQHGINIEQEIINKMAKNKQRGNRGRLK